MLPNHEINTGILSGILIDNAFGPKPKEINKLIEIPNETIYIWTPKKDKYSKLISVVNPQIQELNFWKNFGVIFKYSQALTSNFESMKEMEYVWIENFDKKAKKKELTYPELEKYRYDDFKFNFDLKEIYEQGHVINIRYFEENLKLITELFTNDLFFFAVQHLVSSIENHWFCVECELSPPEYRKHPNHDFDKYYEVYALPRMEVAIIQATKSVEGILGQPGSNREKRLKRWNQFLTIDPNENFLDTNKTYLNFHKHLVNEIRNKVAHNIKSKPFKINRKLTIQAQVYAWTLVNNYYGKLLENETAEENLKINKELLERNKPLFGTILTSNK